MFSFLYVVIRAYLIDITNDEAYSLLLVDTNYINALVGTANTHWINSIFLKLISSIIGIEPWMIRIHSVLSFPVFIYFLYHYYNKLKSLGAKIFLLSLFLINHFTLEYFSLARGYGMSIAFLMGSLYCAYKSLQEDNQSFQNHKFTVIFGVLAVASNYTAFFQFCGIVSFLFVSVYFKTKTINHFFQRRYLPLLLLFVITCIVTVTNLLMIKFLSNDLRFGGDYSFFTNTLDSIIGFMSFVESSNSNGIISFSSFLLFLVLLLISIFGIVKRNINIVFFTSLFFFQFIISNFLFYLFKTPFPLGRSALTLYPSIAFSIIFFVDSINLKEIYKQIFSFIILAGSVLLLAFTPNFNSSFDSFRQSEIKRSLDDIEIIFDNKNHEDSRILVCRNVYSIWINYYNHFYPEKYGLDITVIQQNDKILNLVEYPNFNYLMTARDEDKEIQKKYPELELVKYYPQSGLTIYRINERKPTQLKSKN